jgi:hypothetical protein
MFLMTLAQARAIGLPVDPAAAVHAHSREFYPIYNAGSGAGRLFCEGSTK